MLSAIKRVSARIPRRYILVLLIYLGSCSNEMLRANLSVNLVAMVPVSNNSTSSHQQYTLNWSAYERALVLAAHFWGFMSGNLAGGPIAEKWSPSMMVSVSIFCGGLFNLLSPMAAKQSYVALMVVRVAMGFFAGTCFPGMHALIANWAVPNEKGMFVGALIGGTMGIFFAWILCGYIIEAFGWEWAFYAFGLFFPIISLLWIMLIYDTPDQHPTISEEEKKHLNDRVANQKGKKPIAPIRKFFSCIPVLSLWVLNFGVGWGIYFVITAAPNYIANALRYDITSTGLLSAFIYLIRSLMAIMAGSLGDMCLKKKVVDLTILRKVGVLFSHVLPGCGLLIMAYPNLPTIIYVALIAVSMGLNGLVTLTSAANAHDLTANFAGTLSGFTTSVLTIAGIVTPLVTAHLTKEDETNVDLWRSVFYIAAAVLIFSGLQFIIFGSTKKQKFDEMKGSTRNTTS